MKSFPLNAHGTHHHYQMGDLSAEQFQLLLDGPALNPPPGYVSDFDAPSDRLVIDHVFFALLVIITTVCIVLRLYTKYFIARSLTRDDWLLLAGWVSLMALGAMSEYAREHGGGKHQWDVRLRDMPSILKGVLSASVLYGITTTFVKCSILLQYLSIFNISGERDAVWWSCWSVIWFLCTFYFAASWVEIFACNPIEKIWTPWLTYGTCVNTLAVSIASAVVNMVADVLILLIPQRPIWSLNVPLHKKLKASSIFLVGLFALASSVLRTYYAVQVLKSPDFTYVEDIMGLWAHLEFITTILCACVPALARLGKHIGPAISTHVKHSHSSSRSRSNHTGQSATDLGLDPLRAPSHIDVDLHPDFHSDVPYRTLTNDSSFSLASGPGIEMKPRDTLV